MISFYFLYMNCFFKYMYSIYLFVTINSSNVDVHSHAAHNSQVRTFLNAQPALAARLDAAQPRGNNVGRGDAPSGGNEIPTGAGGATAAPASGAADERERKPLIALKMDFAHFKPE